MRSQLTFRNQIGAILIMLLAGCGPRRFASQMANMSAATAWVQENGIEGAVGSTLVDGAQVLALGESAHGARDVFIERAEITKQLILSGWARALILEADAWDVCALDTFTSGGEGGSRSALARLPGLYQHDDSERFFQWLREHNRKHEPEAQVHVYGMDAQSLSACSAAAKTEACPNRVKLCTQQMALKNAQSLGETYWGRDEIMADNVLSISKKAEGGVIIWAHSAHVSKSAPLLFNGTRKETAPMGWFLGQELGTSYRAATITFRQGSVTIQKRVGFLRLGSFVSVQLTSAPSGTVEGLVPRTTKATKTLSLRSLPLLANSTAWFALPQFSRSIGAVDYAWMLRHNTFAKGWDKYVLRESFDYVIVLPRTRPIHFWFAEGTD